MAVITTESVQPFCDYCGKDLSKGISVRYSGGYKFHKIEVEKSLDGGSYLSFVDTAVPLAVGEFCNVDCYIAHIRRLNK